MFSEVNVIPFFLRFTTFLAGLTKWQPNYFAGPAKYDSAFGEDNRWQF